MAAIPVTIGPTGLVTGAGPFPLVGLPVTITYGVPNIIGTPVIVPLTAVPAQILSITLSDQTCVIKVYFKELYVPQNTGIATEPPVYIPQTSCFLDFYINNQLVVGGVLCVDRNLIIRDQYLVQNVIGAGQPFGDLAVVDTQGTSDPEITSLGSRYLLTYWATLN